MAETDATAEDGDVESWIALTQSTLGRFVEKPRLMADRLRKPPFRFLFDIAVETCRQTGFGVAELFGGNLPAKPSAPGDREGKIAFLDQWVHLLQWQLGPPISGDLTNVQPNNIVCGVKPEWTNYLLQCTATAAWPEQFAAPPRMVEPSALLAPLMEAQAPLAEVPQMAAPLETPLAPLSADTAFEASPAPLEPLAVLEPAAPPIAPDDAATKHFGSALDNFESLHKQFATTAEKWSVHRAQQSAAGDMYDDDSSSDEDLDQRVRSPQRAAGAGAEASPDMPESAARGALTQAKNRFANVDSKMREAEDLLAQIEEGFDRTDALSQQKRAACEEARQKALAEAKMMEQMAVEQQVAQEEEAEKQRLEKQARKAARRAEKERLRLEREAAEKAEEERQRAVFPMSKHSMEHGARIVATLGGDDEYAPDFDQEDAAEEQPQVQVEALAPPPPLSPPPLEGAAAFDLSGVLGEDPRTDLPSSLDPGAGNGGYVLFERVKVQMKWTYTSYLCASMPSTLLKQYTPGDLVGCLQFFLTELRNCLSQHGLEDVMDEEPTTLAEDLHEKFPMDWLLHILDPSALTLCGGKYDVPELIDTLQNLSQTCVDRLEESLGPLQTFVDESSALCYIPPAEPVTVETPPTLENEELSVAANSGGPSDGPWSREIAPAPWESEPAPSMPAQRVPMGMAATMGDFRKPQTAGGLRSAPAAAFDATLGPALWEQEAPPVFPVTSAGPHQMRHATAAPGMRQPLPTTAYGGVPAHPATSHGAPHRPAGRYPAHYVGAR